MNKKISTGFMTLLCIVLMCTVLVLPASAATPITNATLSYTTNHTYTGKYIKPKVTVKLKKKTLSASDYTVSYKNNVNPGTATVTVKGKGKYSGSVTKNFYIKPATPKSFKAAAGVTSVKLSWKKSTGTTSYEVYMYNSKTKNWDKKTTTKETSATVKSLQPGTAYKFRVRAYKKSSKALYSDYTTLTAKTLVDQVKNLKSTATTSSVKLSWSSVKNATGYQVYMYDSAKKTWVKKKTLSGTSYTVTKLKSAAEYKFKVRARNTKDPKTVYGKYSSELLATTLPQSVKNVKINSFTSSTVSLSWDKVTGATGYDIYALKTSSPDKKGELIKLKTTTATSYKLKNLDCCCYYTFLIGSRYKNSKGTLAYGDYQKSKTEQIFTPIAKPSSFTLTQTENKSASVSWKSQPYVSGYHIYIREGDNGELIHLDTVSATRNTYKYTGLNELTYYRLSIRAFYKDSEGNETLSSYAVTTTITDDGSVDGVTFTNAKTSLSIGNTYRFKAGVMPSYAENRKVTFSSSNPAVASIDENGYVTAKKAGTANITVTTQEGSFTDTVKVTVKAVKSTEISLPKSVTVYVDEATQLNPTFSPSDTTNKTFTVSGSDYSYSYKNWLGVTKNDTCSFSDYITVRSDGTLVGKKTTVTPETGKAFSFTVKVKANDSGVTATTKVSVKKKLISLSYQGTDRPWVYGNSAKLTATVDSTADFTKNQLIWESSDTGIAYVDGSGTVYCTGAGNVTISVYSPDKSQKASYNFNVVPKINVETRFYHSCIPGDEYKIEVEVLPEGTAYRFLNADSNITQVDKNGIVTILSEGTATVHVITDSSSEAVVFTTESWTQPETDSQSLFDNAINRMNLIKTEMPTVVKSTSSVFSDFAMSGSNEYITAADLQDIFTSFADPSTVVVNTVSPSASASEKIAYCSRLPVSSSSNAVLPGFSLNDLQSIKYVDSKGPTYDIVFTLKQENMPTPASASTATAHGKVFDILTGAYLNECISKLNSGNATVLGELNVSYSAFSQTYSNSKVTVTVDKITGKTEYIAYDMNLSVDISALKMSMGAISALNSDLSFNVNHKVNLDMLY